MEEIIINTIGVFLAIKLNHQVALLANQRNLLRGRTAQLKQLIAEHSEDGKITHTHAIVDEPIDLIVLATWTSPVASAACTIDLTFVPLVAASIQSITLHSSKQVL